jgi:hypothetical protein
MRAEDRRTEETQHKMPETKEIKEEEDKFKEKMGRVLSRLTAQELKQLSEVLQEIITIRGI